MTGPITKDTTIAELMARSVKLAEVMKRVTGSDCTGCPAATNETVELYAVLHGLDLEEMLQRFNAVED